MSFSRKFLFDRIETLETHPSNKVLLNTVKYDLVAIIKRNPGMFTICFGIDLLSIVFASSLVIWKFIVVKNSISQITGANSPRNVILFILLSISPDSEPCRKKRCAYHKKFFFLSFYIFLQMGVFIFLCWVLCTKLKKKRIFFLLPESFTKYFMWT